MKPNENTKAFNRTNETSRITGKRFTIKQRGVKKTLSVPRIIYLSMAFSCIFGFCGSLIKIKLFINATPEEFTSNIKKNSPYNS